MSVFSSLREASGRRVSEGALFFIFLSAILITSGCAGVVSGNGGPDNQPTPQGAITISNIQATAPTASGFQVGWLTNVPADSQIDYGTSAAYGSTTPLSTTAVTVHQVTLTGLTTGTLYHYRVRSADSKKNQALSSDFTFATSGDTTPPMVSITSPASGATLAGTAAVVANAQDNLSVASVQFKVDGTNSGPSLTTPPYSYSLNTNSLSNGNHTLTATATDAAGNTASSAAVPFVVSNSSTAPPVVSITAPSSGATVSGTTTVTASATSSIGVASVQFQLDGANVGSPVTAAPYSYSWDTTKSSNGSHTLKAIAKEHGGNQHDERWRHSEREERGGGASGVDHGAGEWSDSIGNRNGDGKCHEQHWSCERAIPVGWGQCGKPGNSGAIQLQLGHDEEFQRFARP